MPRNARKKSDSEKEEVKAYTKRSPRRKSAGFRHKSEPVIRMSEAGAKALSNLINDKGLKGVNSQDIISCTPACNGPSHRWVVHVKFKQGQYISSVSVA